MREKNEPPAAGENERAERHVGGQSRTRFWSLMAVLVLVAFLVNYYRMQEQQRRSQPTVCLVVLREHLVALYAYHERHGEWPLDLQLMGAHNDDEVDRRWGCQFNFAYDREYLRPDETDQQIPESDQIILFEKHDGVDGLHYAVGFADGHGAYMRAATFENLLEKTGQTVP